MQNIITQPRKHKFIAKLNCMVIATSLSLVAFSNTAVAATYDAFDSQQNSSNAQDEFFSLDLDKKNLSLEKSANDQSKLNEYKQQYQDILQNIKQKQYTEADLKIKKLLKENPEIAEFYNLQALLAAQQKDYGTAKQSFNKALKLKPNNQRSLFGLAMLALEQQQLNEAEKLANEIITLNKKAAPAYLIIANIAGKQNNLAKVERTLKLAYHNVSGNINSEVSIAANLGKLYIIQNEPQKFLDLAQDLDRLHPDNSRVLALLASAQISNNHAEAATNTLQRLVNKEKNDAIHRVQLAKLLLNQPGNETKIIKLLDEASAIAPNNPRLMLQKSAFLIALKHYDAAFQIALKLDQSTPKSGIGKILQGDIYLAQKKLDFALGAYQQAYNIKKNNKVLNKIVDIMLAQKDPAAAIALLKKELNNNIAAEFKLASVYLQQKNFPEAEKHYLKILQTKPDNPLILNNLAWIYFQRNNPKAEETAKKAYTLAPKSAAIMDTYGIILVHNNRVKQGISLLKQAASLAPNAYDIQYHLAEAHVKNGDKQQAIQILSTLLNIENNFSEKKAASTLLKQLQSH
ncbi:MAG: tetratricopeptide repeat protein [Methyloprofundus sp.]|nr:tetratricopeptide repeat protein [Methyloprofundus sp.]